MSEFQQASGLDEPVVVALPHLPTPQKIIGRASVIAPGVVEEFRGIPYATVPGRWRHSVLRTGLPNDNFYAVNNGPQCPQPPQYATSNSFQSHLDWPENVGESEFDCLNLFIVRPSASCLRSAGVDKWEDVKLPVYLNIHGGGFGWGAGTDPMWDPTRLVMRSITEGNPLVAVTINYRLGIFGMGFCSDMIVGQEEANELQGGNFGLGDQRIAMRWVTQNIAAFGGDPDKVTISGQSAGAVGVHAHILEAKFGTKPPLFRRAIQQSGALRTMVPMKVEEADQKWSKLYDRLGVIDKAPKDRLKVLLDMTAAELLDVAISLGWLTWHPVEDALTIHACPSGGWRVFLGQREDLHEQQKPAPKDPIYILIGDCEDECGLVENVTRLRSFAEIKELFNSCVPPVPQAAIDELLAAYELTPSCSLPEAHRNLSKFMSDRQFSYPVEDARREFASTLYMHKKMPRNIESAIRTEIRPYRFKCGNPFPGPRHNVAHHSVEFIYTHDCFHGDLARRDCIEESSGLRLLGQASNLSLVSEVQKWWVDFITNDTVYGDENTATVIDVDRRLYIRDISKDGNWAAMIARMNVVGRHFDDATKIWHSIRTM